MDCGINCEKLEVKNYIGIKAIKAIPMTAIERNAYFPNIKPSTEEVDGYKVIYPDGYESWSPKSVFEKAYMKIGEGNKIAEDNVNDFIVDYEVKKWGDKTTIVKATLSNGFVLVESSSCVDPENYNEDIGYNICKEKIQNEVWKMLGFILQCGLNGLK